MNATLLYIGTPNSRLEPVIQMENGSKAVITSIRICAPQNKNGIYEIHHVAKGGTAATTANALAFNVTLAQKTAAEFLVHPLPISPGESLWISGDGVTFAVYGILL